MSPNETVKAFISLLSTCLEALLQEYLGTDRPTVWTGLWLVPRDGSKPVRSGVLPGLGTFKLHGIGCRFELDTGELLDVSWDEQGRAIFDSWRIEMFARSIGDTLTEIDSLTIAAAESSAIIQISSDTFTWPDRRFDAAR